jgi:hypothetical protein
LLGKERDGCHAIMRDDCNEYFLFHYIIGIACTCPNNFGQISIAFVSLRIMLLLNLRALVEYEILHGIQVDLKSHDNRQASSQHMWTTACLGTNLLNHNLA